MAAHLDWVKRRGAEAPPALVRRVVAVIESDGALADVPLAEALIRAGETLLASVLAPTAGQAREAALDLLAADACVTWAFEAAADSPETIVQRAEDAMRRIAAVAA